ESRMNRKNPRWPRRRPSAPTLRACLLRARLPPPILLSGAPGKGTMPRRAGSNGRRNECARKNAPCREPMPPDRWRIGKGRTSRLENLLHVGKEIDAEKFEIYGNLSFVSIRAIRGCCSVRPLGGPAISPRRAWQSHQGVDRNIEDGSEH